MAEIRNTDAVITLTENAAAQIRELRAQEPGGENKCLRIKVTTGGCSGKEYEMAFDEPAANDLVVPQHGVNVVMDPTSAEILAGTEIDYLDSLNGGGFKVNIPRATQTCGCGKSFQA